MLVLLRDDSDLQRVPTARLLDRLYEFPGLLARARRGRLAKASRKIPRPLQDYPERSLTEPQDILNLDMEVYLPGKLFSSHEHANKAAHRFPSPLITNNLSVSLV